MDKEKQKNNYFIETLGWILFTILFFMIVSHPIVYNFTHEKLSWLLPDANILDISGNPTYVGKFVHGLFLGILLHISKKIV